MVVDTCLDISSQDMKKYGKGNVLATIVVGALLTAVSVPAIEIDKETFFSMPRLETTVIRSEQTVVIQKKSIRERYRRMAKTQWFKNAYENRSIGEIMSIEE